MKKIFLLFTFILYAFVFIADAQKNSEWTRIESENKEVSAAFPQGFLVDAEKKDYDNQHGRIIAFQNSVQMELTIYDADDPKESLRNINEKSGEKNRGFTAHGFIGKRFSHDKEGEFSESIFLISKKTLYHFYVFSKSADKAEISRFIYSIKVGDKPLFVNKDELKDVAETPVSIALLKTSPEVAEALSRQTEKSNRQINYESEGPKEIIKESDDSIRPPIILVSPYSAVSYAVKPQVIVYRKREGNGAAKFKVQLLANGQIGNITVYTKSDRAAVYDLLEGIKLIKFIPAQKDGKLIDMEMIFDIETSGF